MADLLDGHSHPIPPTSVACRLCDGRRATGRARRDLANCPLCKGCGELDPADVDRWTFADLDEPLGSGGMGAKPPPRPPYVHPNAAWHTWLDENGRGYMWSELRVQ